jgi:drug/metabolite transporter (DMT)-like permease
MKATHRTAATGTLTIAILSWALSPIFIRFLSDAYDPYSQAFIRYLSAAIVLVGVSMVMYRREFMRLLQHPAGLIGIAALNVFQQTTWTMGCYDSVATVAQLITKLSAVLVIIFSFFLFHEERTVIKSPLYLAGTALSFAGVAGVLASDGTSLMPVLDKSSVFLMITAFCWSIYMVWAKHLVKKAHPIPMFTVVAVFTTLGFGALSCGLGRPGTLLAAGPRITAIAFVSGLFPIAAAHPAFHFAQKHLGSAFSSSCNLATPLVTYLLAQAILPDEYLTPSQWVGAAILTAGTTLVTVAGLRATRQAATLPTETA